MIKDIERGPEILGIQWHSKQVIKTKQKHSVNACKFPFVLIPHNLSHVRAHAHTELTQPALLESCSSKKGGKKKKKGKDILIPSKYFQSKSFSFNLDI